MTRLALDTMLPARHKRNESLSSAHKHSVVSSFVANATHSRRNSQIDYIKNKQNKYSL